MQRKLLTNGNVFKLIDGRWNGAVWYLDEQGQRKRKSFCGTSKSEAKEKITEYIAGLNCSRRKPGENVCPCPAPADMLYLLDVSAWFSHIDF